MTADLLVAARQDCRSLVTAMRGRDTQALLAVLDGCTSPIGVALHEAARLLRDSYWAVIALDIGCLPTPHDIETALNHPSVDIAQAVNDAHPGVWLPAPVRAWLYDVIRGNLYPPTRDPVLHLASALWCAALVWDYAPPGSWADYCAFRDGW
jgi:hypothetical protein